MARVDISIHARVLSSMRFQSLRRPRAGRHHITCEFTFVPPSIASVQIDRREMNNFAVLKREPFQRVCTLGRSFIVTKIQAIARAFDKFVIRARAPSAAQLRRRDSRGNSSRRCCLSARAKGKQTFQEPLAGGRAFNFVMSRVIKIKSFSAFLFTKNVFRRGGTLC